MPLGSVPGQHRLWGTGRRLWAALGELAWEPGNPSAARAAAPGEDSEQHPRPTPGGAPRLWAVMLQSTQALRDHSCPGQPCPKRASQAAQRPPPS